MTMASSRCHSTSDIRPCNDKIRELYRNTVESDHQDLVKEGVAERRVVIFPRIAELCRHHHCNHAGAAALKAPSAQQWKSARDTICEFDIKRGFSLKIVKRELASQDNFANSRMLKDRHAHWDFHKNASNQDCKAFAILQDWTFAAESQHPLVEIHQSSYDRWAAAPASTEQNAHSQEFSELLRYLCEYSVEEEQGPRKCREDGCVWLGKTPADLKKHETQYGFAHKCGMEDYSRVFATVNHLGEHKACVHESGESGTQVSRRLSGFQELESLETEWPRLEDFRLYMSQHHLIEDEDNQKKKSLEKWNDQHRALGRELISASTSVDIKKNQDGIAMLSYDGLQEIPADHCTSRPTRLEMHRQMRALGTSRSYHLHDHLLSGTEDHAKRTDRGAVAVRKPYPRPARMSPDDDDDDESYGFHRAQSSFTNRQREEWRAVIARVCDPLSRATEHETGRLCKGRLLAAEG